MRRRVTSIKLITMSLLTGMLVPLALLVAPAAHAAPNTGAGEPQAVKLADAQIMVTPQGPGVQAIRYTMGYLAWGRGVERVDIWWGYAYNTDNNHLRARAVMDAASITSVSGRIRVRAVPLNLGDLNGVLRSASSNPNSGYLVLETGYVGCSRSRTYQSNLHFSITWPDGAVTSNQTGQMRATGSQIC